MSAHQRLLLSAIAVLSLLMAALSPTFAQTNWQQQQWQRQQQQMQQQQLQRQQQEQAARRAREAQEAARRAQQERIRQEQIRQQQIRQQQIQQQRQQQIQQQQRQQQTQQQKQRIQPPGRTQMQAQQPRTTVSQLARKKGAATTQRPTVTQSTQSALRAKLAALKTKAANDNTRPRAFSGGKGGGSAGKLPPSSGYGGGKGGKPPPKLRPVFNKAVLERSQAQKLQLRKESQLKLEKLKKKNIITNRFNYAVGSFRKPLGLGSTGRTEPKNMRENIAMQQVMSKPWEGTPVRLREGMKDNRWPEQNGWVKMRQNVMGIEIHYVRNMHNGDVDDFKFKDDKE